MDDDKTGVGVEAMVGVSWEQEGEDLLRLIDSSQYRTNQDGNDSDIEPTTADLGAVDLDSLSGSINELLEENSALLTIPVPMKPVDAVEKAVGNMWRDGKDGACEELLEQSVGIEAVMLPHDRSSTVAYGDLMRAVILAGFKCPIACCDWVTPSTKNVCDRKEMRRDLAGRALTIPGKIFVDMNQIAQHWETSHMFPVVQTQLKAQCISIDENTGLRCTTMLSASLSDLRRHMERMHAYVTCNRDSEARMAESVEKVPKRTMPPRMKEEEVEELFNQGLVLRNGNSKPLINSPLGEIAGTTRRKKVPVASAERRSREVNSVTLTTPAPGVSPDRRERSLQRRGGDEAKSSSGSVKAKRSLSQASTHSDTFTLVGKRRSGKDKKAKKQKRLVDAEFNPAKFGVQPIDMMSLPATTSTKKSASKKSKVLELRDEERRSATLNKMVDPDKVRDQRELEAFLKMRTSALQEIEELRSQIARLPQRPNSTVDQREYFPPREAMHLMANMNRAFLPKFSRTHTRLLSTMCRLGVPKDPRNDGLADSVFRTVVDSGKLLPPHRGESTLSVNPDTAGGASIQLVDTPSENEFGRGTEGLQARVVHCEPQSDVAASEDQDYAGTLSVTVQKSPDRSLVASPVRVMPVLAQDNEVTTVLRDGTFKSSCTMTLQSGRHESQTEVKCLEEKMEEGGVTLPTPDSLTFAFDPLRSVGLPSTLGPLPVSRPVLEHPRYEVGHPQVRYQPSYREPGFRDGDDTRTMANHARVLVVSDGEARQWCYHLEGMLDMLRSSRLASECGSAAEGFLDQWKHLPKPGT